LAEAIAGRYGVPLVAVTRPPGEEPGDLLLAHGEIRYAPRYPVEIVDRIGAGDSFVAGLIHGLLDGDLDLAIRLAAYAAAVAPGIPARADRIWRLPDRADRRWARCRPAPRSRSAGQARGRG